MACGRRAAWAAAAFVLAQVFRVGRGDEAFVDPRYGRWKDPRARFYGGAVVAISARGWYLEGGPGREQQHGHGRFYFDIEKGSEWYLVDGSADGLEPVRTRIEHDSRLDVLNAMQNSSGVQQGWALTRQEVHKLSVVHWALVSVLSIVLVIGLFRVYRVLQGLDAMTTALRSVPEGMRPAQCGSCSTIQYIANNGRIFICCGCQAANRIPYYTMRSDAQMLVTPRGPLRSYEFRKEGANFWQELHSEELPLQGAEGEVMRPSFVETQQLHFKGTYCRTCQDHVCRRAEEFPPDTVVAYLPPQAGEGENAISHADRIVQPTIMGRQAEADGAGADEVTSTISVRTTDGLSQCVVCLDKVGCMVLLPCAHGSVCEECATRIAQNRASGGAHCPHCRTGIETLVRIQEIDGDVAKGIEVRIPMARPRLSA